MSVHKLTPHPRCTVMCTDEQGDIVQCALWADHQPADEHARYEDVIMEMAEALAQVRGEDWDNMNPFAQLLIVHTARRWYMRLVVQDAH